MIPDFRVYDVQTNVNKASFIMYATGGGGGEGGQMILRGDLNFFGKEQGGMSRFFRTGRGGGANFFL